MNIAIMSHTKKQDLMVQFCTAYAGILSQHNLYCPSIPSAPPTPPGGW